MAATPVGWDATQLPTLDEIFQLKVPTLRYIPSKGLPAFACALSTALRSVVHENSIEAWIKLLMVPKCCLPSLKRKGCHHKPADLKALCDLWSRGQFGALWCLVRSTGKSHEHMIQAAVSLAQDGLYSKACQLLSSSGVAPNTPETWQLLQAMHPEGPIPVSPEIHSDAIGVAANFDFMALLRSFPKATAAGPSGLRVQHLLDAAACCELTGCRESASTNVSISSWV